MVRYLAGGRYELGEAAPVEPAGSSASAWLVATVAALVPLAFGGQVFQSAIVEVPPAAIGDIKLVTSLFFDIGVYLVVVGLMLDMLRSLGGGIDTGHRDERRAAPTSWLVRRSRPRADDRRRPMTVNLVLIIVIGVHLRLRRDLLLERSLTRILVGILLLGNAVNLLFLVASGAPGRAPIVDESDARHR